MSTQGTDLQGKFRFTRGFERELMAERAFFLRVQEPEKDEAKLKPSSVYNSCEMQPR